MFSCNNMFKRVSGLRVHIKSVPVYVQHNKHSEILLYSSSLTKANNCAVYRKKFLSPVITAHCIIFIL